MLVTPGFTPISLRICNPSALCSTSAHPKLPWPCACSLYAALNVAVCRVFAPVHRPVHAHGGVRHGAFSFRQQRRLNQASGALRLVDLASEL